ncbi:MAG: sel1 repeat family protein [Prosthecobacter sp.]|uniref:tetratricopeptide repeat protein n=1 Tax=Prosthecobacter sp. TaxID=1965333 RepID=UPI0025D595E2|nr:tetratricopeptide repeat protein [Prosthecobacter sp.]MCF7785852.1 sel1 repeat family protein [Prosthecobacter sp.]
MITSSVRSILSVITISFLVSCGRENVESTLPDKKTNFQQKVFAETGSDKSITLISETECEINQGGGNIFLAEYSRQGDKLRIVAHIAGASVVMYFDFIDQGLRDSNTGQVLLLPDALARARAQIQAARDAEIAQQQRARQMEIERRQQQVKAYQDKCMALRDKGMKVIRDFFANGSIINADYMPDHYRGVQFVITLTSEVSFVAAGNDPYDQTFVVYGTTRWISGNKDSITRKGRFSGNVIVQRDRNNNSEATLAVEVAFGTERDGTVNGIDEDQKTPWNGTEFRAKPNFTRCHAYYKIDHIKSNANIDQASTNGSIKPFASQEMPKEAQNMQWAQYNLGLLYASDKAFQVILKAGENGSAYEQGVLGYMYETGQGVPKDESMAIKWYSKAAELGDPGAQTNLGLMYATGRGTPVKKLLAYTWFVMALSNNKNTFTSLQAQWNKELLEKTLTPEERNIGQRMARDFKSRMTHTKR